MEQFQQSGRCEIQVVAIGQDDVAILHARDPGGSVFLFYPFLGGLIPQSGFGNQLGLSLVVAVTVERRTADPVTSPRVVSANVNSLLQSSAAVDKPSVKLNNVGHFFGRPSSFSCSRLGGNDREVHGILADPKNTQSTEV